MVLVIADYHCPAALLKSTNVAVIGSKVLSAHNVAAGTARVSHSDARAKCQTMGGDLAQFKNEQEWSAIVSVMSKERENILLKT